MTFPSQPDRRTAASNAGGRRIAGAGGAVTTIGNGIPAAGQWLPSRITERDARAELAEHVGPIAGVLVRRASGSTTNLREMCDALAQEIASPAARQKFLSAVHSHLRISGQY